MSHYDYYYKEQGGRGVHNVFVGSRNQRGHGVGSWLAGLFRSAIPLISKGARAIGKEAVRAGVNILDDVTDKNVSFKDSFQNRVNESGNKLKRKAVDKIHNLMEGSGYKAVASKRSLQYPWSSGAVHINSKQSRSKSKRGRRRRNNTKKRKSVKRLKSKSKSKNKKRKTQKKKKSKILKKSKKHLDIFN